MNKTLDFAGLRVYGLLTDLSQFTFYSYDPSTKQFFFDEFMVVANKRIPAYSDMIEGLCISPLCSHRPDFFSVVNKIFGLVLTGYVDGLRAIVKRSQDRAKRNDVSPSLIYRARYYSCISSFRPEVPHLDCPKNLPPRR